MLSSQEGKRIAKGRRGKVAKCAWVALLLCWSLLVGCQEPGEVVVTQLVEVTTEVTVEVAVVVTATPQPATKVPTATSTLAPTGTPVSVATQGATPTITPSAALEVAGETVALPDMPVLQPPTIGQEEIDFASEQQALREWTLLARRSGLDFYGQVQGALIKSGWAQSAELLTTDFDNDGSEEWLISFSRPWQNCFRPNPDKRCSGGFWLVGDDGIEFEFPNPDDNLEIYDSGPTVEFKQLTPDFLTDVVITTSGCGAHTCWQNIYVVSGELGEVQHVVQSPTEREQWGKSILFYVSAENSYPNTAPDNINMTYSEHAIIDINGDGRDDIIMEGGWAGSAGSGIQRTRTEVWGWDGTGIGLVDLIWHEPVTLLHRLWEASDLYDMGQFEAAKEQFAQLVSERDVEPDEDDPSFVVLDQAVRVANFSAFRLGLLAFEQNDAAALNQWIAWLTNSLEPENPLLSAAQRLQQQLAAGVSIEVACSEIVAQLNAVEGLGINLPYEYGYGNPAFHADDLCPHGQSIE